MRLESPFDHTSPSPPSHNYFDDQSPFANRNIFGDALNTSKETYAKKLDRAIDQYTELINILESRPPSVEKAREAELKHSAPLSAQYNYGLYDRKSTSRIRDGDLHVPVISEDHLYPTNFSAQPPRIGSRDRGLEVGIRGIGDDEVFYEDEGEKQRPTKPPSRSRHYYDQDWWIHAKLHELPHTIKQMQKENRDERASIDLEYQKEKNGGFRRNPLSAKNYSDELPDLQPKSPFYTSTNANPSFSIPANRDQLLAYIKTNCPLLTDVAKNVVHRKKVDNLLAEFQKSLEHHAELLDKRILRTKIAQRKAIGRTWSELTRQIELDEKERDISIRKSKEIVNVMQPLYPHVIKTTKTNEGNVLNQLRILQTIFDHP